MEKKLDDLSSSEQLKHKIQSWLLGWAIGDALGAPVEMTTQEQIFEKHGRVEDYLPIKNNMFFKKHGFESDESWRVTDDTILTFALIKSYNELGRLDLDDIFKKHQEEYEKFPYGFGSATKYGMKNIQEWVPLEKSGKKDAAGNGVVMKQFPFAIIAASKNIPDEEMLDMIITHAKATHDSDTAVISSLVHHKFLKALLEIEPGKLDKKELLQRLIDFIKPYEKKYPQDEWKVSSILIKLYDLIDEKTNKISLSDEEIIEQFGRWKLDENNPRDIFKSGYVIFTLWIVYAIFLRDENFDVILNAVNIWWDVDSYGAIAGNMVGAYKGMEYEKKYIDGLQKKEGIISDINAFIAKLFSE